MDNEEEYKRFIPEEEKRTTYHDGYGQSQSFQCPRCGSWNTGQATYVDYCNTCDWSEGY
jgi:hypothetical protein